MDIYEKLQCGKETVAFRVSNQISASSHYGHIVVDVVYVREENGFYNDSLGFYDNYHNQKHHYKGLTVRCQMDKHCEQPYRWNLVFDDNKDLSNLSLKKAEEIVKTLRPINKKLNKIMDAEGDVGSFEEFIARLGRVLNVKAFYGKYGSNIQYKRNDNIGVLRDHLRSLISDNQMTLGFTKAA